jgi:carboxymethylenebutenolidase
LPDGAVDVLGRGDRDFGDRLAGGGVEHVQHGGETTPLRARMRAVVVTREYVDVPVGERAMRTFVAAPAAEGSYPGVVFYTDIFQLTEPSLRWAVRLAGYGFVVAVPEIYHRLEPAGTVLEFDDAGKVRGQADADATPVPDFDEDVQAALAWLSERCSSVGAAGHCTGGHIAFRAAFDERVLGTVCWYPTGLHDGKLGKDPTDSLDRAGEIDGEILLIFGTADPHTPAEGRSTIRAGMEASGARFGWSEYEAEHAFGRDIGPRFDPEVTDQAFAETVSFFRRVL